MMRRRAFWIPACAGMTTSLVVVLVLLFSTAAFAETPDADNTSHLPVPRFAALRSGEVNLRTGPDTLSHRMGLCAARLAGGNHRRI